MFVKVVAVSIVQIFLESIDVSGRCGIERMYIDIATHHYTVEPVVETAYVEGVIAGFGRTVFCKICETLIRQSA